MASHVYPLDLGLVFHLEQSFKRISKDFQHCLPCHGSNQDIISPLTLKTTSIFDCNCVARSGSNILRPDFKELDDIDNTSVYKSGIHQDSVLFSSDIAEQYTKQEKILKLLTSGSIEVEGGLLDMSLLYDMVWARPLIADYPLLTSHSRCIVNDYETQQSLIYPTNELYLDEPVVEIPGDCCNCTESSFNSNGQLLRSSSMTEIDDIIQ